MGPVSLPVPCDSCLHCVTCMLGVMSHSSVSLPALQNVSSPLTVAGFLCRFKEYQDLAQLRFNFAGEHIPI